MWRVLALQSLWRFGSATRAPFLLHPSWLLFAVLVTYLLGEAYAPLLFPEQEPPGRWLRAFLTNLLLLGSVALHEAAHLAVAARARLPLRRVVLFPFGGVRARSRATKTAGAPPWQLELLLGVAGPAASLALGLGLLLAPAGMQPLATWVGGFNLLLALLNLLPITPLDGAGLLRALGRARWLSPLRLARFSFQAGDLLGTAFAWLGLALVVIGGAAEGFLLLLFGCLFQLAGNVYLAGEDPWEQQLLRRTPLARLVAGRRAIPTPRPDTLPLPAHPRLPRPAAALHLTRWSVPATTTLLEALERLERPEAPPHLLIVDGACVVGVCSHADLLEYLLAHKEPTRRT